MSKHEPLSCPECGEEVETEFTDISDEYGDDVEALPVNDHCEHCGEPLYSASGALRGFDCGGSEREDFHSDI